MRQRLRRLLPTPQAVRESRWLRWIGPALHHPRLWHVSRRGIALGTALGVFFGLLIPIAQIPVAAGVAVLLRANVPTAIASTLVTNPLTFAPVYYAAWRLGHRILGAPDAVQGVPTGPLPPPPEPPSDTGVLTRAWERISGVGKPLIVGLAVIATGAGLGVYALISAGWHLKVRLQRWRRLRLRRRRAGAADH